MYFLYVVLRAHFPGSDLLQRIAGVVITRNIYVLFLRPKLLLQPHGHLASVGLASPRSLEGIVWVSLVKHSDPATNMIHVF